MNEHRQSRLTAGLVLIVVGLAFFLAPRFDVFQLEYIFLILGLAFLTAYFVRKRFGLLVPGGVLFGLGLGAVFDHSVAGWGNGEQLGLGLGFVMIYVVAMLYQRRSHWWPLIPGAALILTGLDRTADFAGYLFENWPLILVIVGVALVFGGLSKGRRRGTES